MDRDQRIRDPVHNLVKFSKNNPDDKVLWELLQTAPMQRLRRIRQLGFSEFVYPGATHTRLSHSIGAMQMARRMLAVLERNKVGSNIPSFPTWRRATLCAALLHDIGHGPYSHVFEEVSRALKLSKHHEEYTREIIQSDEIANVLVRGKVFEKTVSFFKKEPGSTFFSNVISSQLDADRLDFLTRDRYFSGIRSSQIDLEWLFDSLRIEKTALELGTDAKVYSFVVDVKGLGVLEEYILSYVKMYNNIYFHKTTRSVQFMVQDIIISALNNKRLVEEKLANHPVTRYFTGGGDKTSQYLGLDDAAVMSFLSAVQSASGGRLKRLCERYFMRDLYKCFAPPKAPKESLSRDKITNFESELKKSGLRHHSDLVPVKGFKQYEISSGEEFLKNILVRLSNRHDPKPVGELLPHVLNFADKEVIRFYFENDEARSKAAKIWRRLG